MSTNTSEDQCPVLRFAVKGMSCAACSARVEKAVAAVPGVSQVAVNLLKNSMTVEVTGPEVSDRIVEAVDRAGYGAEPVGPGARKKSSGKKAQTPQKENDPAAETRFRLIVSFCFLIPLAYIVDGRMLGLPVPGWLDGPENALVNGLVQFLLTLGPLYVNRIFFIRGFKALWNRAPNMDSLVAVGAGASLVFGIWTLLAMAHALGVADTARVAHLAHNLYLEGVATILTLITLGKHFEARAKGKTSEAIEKLMALAPDEATVIRDGKEVTIARDDVAEGDVVVLKTGSTVPVDGFVLEGTGTLDESTMTGESLPVMRSPGDTLTSATLVVGGRMTMRATRVGEDTTLARIIQMVDEATSSKAPIARIADRVAGIFVPVVLLISLVTLLVWIFLGAEAEFAITCAVSVLVISCPCSLGLATPTAIMVGTGRGASQGILFKNAAALERLQGVKRAVLDKTGTVTEGKPVVTSIAPAAPGLEVPLLMTAASLEALSEHPLGAAILAKAGEKHLPKQPVQNFRQHAGLGISGEIGGRTYFAGNRKMAEGLVAGLPPALAAAAEAAAGEGETPLFIGSTPAALTGEGLPQAPAAEGSLLGVIAVADTVKPDSPAAVAALKQLGIEVTMLTGDNEKTARAIAGRTGIGHVIAGVRPEGKAKEVAELQSGGAHVLMVGDGVNDAPALAAADVGAAIGAGTDVAVASADVVLMRNSLLDVVSAIELSRAVIVNIRQNLFWAFFYNVLGIPIAAGCLAAWGITLNPMFAAAAMSLSSVCVVSNALRLRLFRPKLAEAARAQTLSSSQTSNQKGDSIMEKLIHIEGMHCHHCTANVEKALSALPGVSAVKADLEGKCARVTVAEFVTNEMLASVVEGAGFKVTGIE